MSARSLAGRAAGLLAVIGLVAPLAACDRGAPEAPPPGGTATLVVALTGTSFPGLQTVELTVADATGQPVHEDVLVVASGPPVLSRNYRLEPGTYDLTAAGRDAAGQPLLEGSAPGVVVLPGDNTVSLPLRPVGDDLGDLLVELGPPRVRLESVSAPGDTLEGAGAAVDLRLEVLDPALDPGQVQVEGVLRATDASGDEVPLLVFPLGPDPLDPLRRVGTFPTDPLGRYHLEIVVEDGGAEADSTAKAIVGHPAADTEALLGALQAQLVVDPVSGTIAPLTGLSVPGGPSLTPTEVAAANDVIGALNVEIQAGNLAVAADLSNVLAPIAFGARGYWWCFVKILACEALTAGCIAAAPVAAAGCGAVCAGTAGVGCAACIVAAVGGGVAVCDSALSCWGEAQRERCIP